MRKRTIRSVLRPTADQVDAFAEHARLYKEAHDDYVSMLNLRSANGERRTLKHNALDEIAEMYKFCPEWQHVPLTIFKSATATAVDHFDDHILRVMRGEREKDWSAFKYGKKYNCMLTYVGDMHGKKDYVYVLGIGKVEINHQFKFRTNVTSVNVWNTQETHYKCNVHCQLRD